METTTRRVGLWSALLVAAFTIWFMIAFGLYSPPLFNWQGIEQFAQSFNEAGYVAWVLPCLLLALTFPVLGVAIRTTDYWLLLTVVRESIVKGNHGGLEWLIVGSRAGKWAAGLLLVNGAATILSFAVAVFGLTLISWIVLGIWGISFPAAMVLIAIFIARLRPA